MSVPDIKETIHEMRGLINEMNELNTSLTTGKVNKIPNFQALSNRKVVICDLLMKDHLQPYLDKRNAYIKAHPAVRLSDDRSNTIKSHIKEERSATEKSIKDPDYVPILPIVSTVMVAGINRKSPKEKMIEIQESRDREINNLNKTLGGKVFLRRDEYVERSTKKHIFDRFMKKGASGEREL